MTQWREEGEKEKGERTEEKIKWKREEGEIEISLDNGNLVAVLIKQINLVQRWNKAYRKALNLPRPLARNSLWLGTTLHPTPPPPLPTLFPTRVTIHKCNKKP